MDNKEKNKKIKQNPDVKPKKLEHLYLKLFTSTFYLSAFTFGGGYVIIPLMKKNLLMIVNG